MATLAGSTFVGGASGGGPRFASPRALIVRLLQAGRPAAVARLIVAVVVDAIERMQERGARAHVGVEGGERVPPAIADGDAAAAVIRPRGVRATETAAFHGAPRFVFGRALQAVGAPCAVEIREQASATSGMPAPQRSRGHLHGIAAIAPRQPDRLVVSVMQRSRRDDQPADTLPDAIDKRHSHRLQILPRAGAPFAPDRAPGGVSRLSAQL